MPKKILIVAAAVIAIALSGCAGNGSYSGGHGGGASSGGHSFVEATPLHWIASRLSFSEGDCTEYQESAALPVGTTSCGRVPCAERRQAMPLNRKRQKRRPCASLGHRTP